MNKTEIFNLIRSTIKALNFKNVTSYLCQLGGVSRSGYYNYLKSENSRILRDKKDLASKELILRAFNIKGFKKGSRSIKMNLLRHLGVNFNLKRIKRIMKKYDIICPFRKANVSKRMAKANKEHTTLPNTLKRNFKQGVAGKVLLTDITYLPYGSGKRAYLSVIKDGSTNEILSYHMLNNMTLEIAIKTIEKLKSSKIELSKSAFIHSDQGVHYTSPTFQKLLVKYEIGQSMSRRGNCWDNAPIESFFGHMKDEVELKKFKIYKDLKKEIDKYMDYYNNHRPQWNLNRLTPVEYRNQLLSK